MWSFPLHNPGGLRVSTWRPLQAVDDDIVDLAPNVAGRPFDELLRGWTSLSHVILPIADRTLAPVER